VNVTELDLPGVRLIEPRRFGDARGWFMEIWNQERYHAAGLEFGFVQDNLSFSSRGVLRGLHFQDPHPQGKLVWVGSGEIWDVAADVRPDSPTFGKWVASTLSAENGRQLFIPEGYAHGFVVLSEQALVAYKCTTPYRPECEHTIRWDDPDLGIDWPINAPIVSEKDVRGNWLAELKPAP
jgi:dTDP-4-dehydrorhamnose 3,5-epimerase